MTATETRSFKMHPKLLFDVIQRQAGTLAKAILEGVMNSIDAKATKCVITLTNSELTISDDGIGMTERRQIEDFFETFGKPHDESEGKVYGTFRMGRGQLFAFGRNRWRTGPFEMNVDIKGKGLDYDLIEHPDREAGCTVYVSLYDQLHTSNLLETVRLVRMWTKYAQIPVFLGKEQISVDPAKEKWDHVTEDAYARLNSSGEVSVYNLGVYVCGMPNHRFGTGGVVVSRKQLRMNFARNDIQADCPVWKRVRPFLVAKAEKEMKKEALTPWQRTRLVNKLQEEELDEKARRELLEDKKLVVLSSGRALAIQSLSPWGRQMEEYARKITWAAKGDMDGDRVTQHRMALVISGDTLTDFGYEESDDGLQNFIDWLDEKFFDKGWRDKDRKWEVVPLSSFRAKLGVTTLIEPDKWTPNQQVWARFATTMVRWCYVKERKVRIGSRAGVRAWTDGKDNIYLEAGWLKKLRFNTESMVAFLLTLLHELAHDDSTENTHIHGVEFYERLDHLLDARLPGLISSGPLKLIDAIKEGERQVSKDAAWLNQNAEKLEKRGKAITSKMESLASRYSLIRPAPTEPQAAPAKGKANTRKPKAAAKAVLFDPVEPIEEK